MNKPLYSIRMRARRQGQHLSGAERLSSLEAVEQLAADMVQRAMHHARGRAESIELTIEQISAAEVERRPLPDLQTWLVDDYRQGRRAAAEILRRAGVAQGAIDGAMSQIAAGAAPGAQTMRGAMLVDADSGQRLEPDQARGVRVSRMDLTDQARRKLDSELNRLGLNNAHVREALVLAAKVLSAPGIVAELCWSDDPDYTAGYVASAAQGYVRFPHLKPLGEERGGRAFFVRTEGRSLADLIDYLQKRPILFDQIGRLHSARPWEAHL